MPVSDRPPSVESRCETEGSPSALPSLNQRAAITEMNPGGNSPRDPKILLTDTDRRAYAARLALALAEAGCEVSAICSTDGHPLLKTSVVQRIFPYRALRPKASLLRAIETIQPDLVIPCDDRGVRHLHELCAESIANGASGNAVAKLIRRSLGSPESHSIVSARYDLLKIATQEGLRVPHTAPVHTIEDFKALQETMRFPWVLKADETWGGRGVRIAHTLEEARQFFLDVSRPFRLRRAIKRMVVNRDPFWLQPWWEGRKASVIAQGHVQGRPANCAVFCWEGKIVAGIGVEVVASDGPTGPASVVRIVENADMMLCAERLARRLRLSGFFGLDFMLEDGTGDTYLIEMNPRTTPLCHLRLGKGHDMIGGVWAQLSGQPDPEKPTVTDKDLIAYFPQDGTSNRELLEKAYQDVPSAGDELIQELLRPWPERSLLFRMTMRMQSRNNE